MTRETLKKWEREICNINNWLESFKGNPLLGRRYLNQDLKKMKVKDTKDFW